jgi:hypothetical protein
MLKFLAPGNQQLAQGRVQALPILRWPQEQEAVSTPSAFGERLLCRLELSNGAGPVFDVIGGGNSAVSNRVNVDRHDPERLGTVKREPHEITFRTTGGDAPDDDPVAILKHVLNLPFEIRDQFPKMLKLADQLRFGLGLCRIDRSEVIGQQLTQYIANICRGIHGQALRVKRCDDFLWIHLGDPQNAVPVVLRVRIDFEAQYYQNRTCIQ